MNVSRRLVAAALAFALCVPGVVPNAAQQLDDQQVYEKFRAWVTRQPPAPAGTDPVAQQADDEALSRGAAGRRTAAA